MSRNKRLFFALWPDDRVRSELAHLQTILPQATGNWVHPQDLHMTLQFLGSVDANAEACIMAAAEAVRGSRFTMEISRLDFWPKPRIAWAGLEQTPAELSALVKALGARLGDCGFCLEKRVYRPHVTLLRKTTPSMAASLPQPIYWEVDHFVLVASRLGGAPPWYSVVRRWEL